MPSRILRVAPNSIWTDDVFPATTTSTFTRGLRNHSLRKATIEQMLQLSDASFSRLSIADQRSLVEAIIRFHSPDFSPLIEKLDRRNLIDSRLSYFILHLTIKYRKFACMMWFLESRANFFFQNDCLDPELMMEVMKYYLYEVRQVNKVPPLYQFLTSLFRWKRKRRFRELLLRSLIDNVQRLNHQELSIILELYEQLSFSLSSTISGRMFAGTPAAADSSFTSLPSVATASKPTSSTEANNSPLTLRDRLKTGTTYCQYGPAMKVTKAEEFHFFRNLLQQSLINHNFTLSFETYELYRKLNPYTPLFDTVDDPVPSTTTTTVVTSSPTLTEEIQYHIDLFSILLTLYTIQAEVFIDTVINANMTISPTQFLSQYQGSSLTTFLQYEEKLRTMIYMMILEEYDRSSVILANTIIRFFVTILKIRLIPRTHLIMNLFLWNTLLRDDDEQRKEKAIINTWNDHECFLFFYLQRFRRLGHDFLEATGEEFRKYVEFLGQSPDLFIVPSQRKINSQLESSGLASYQTFFQSIPQISSSLFLHYYHSMEVEIPPVLQQRLGIFRTILSLANDSSSTPPTSPLPQFRHIPSFLEEIISFHQSLQLAKTKFPFFFFFHKKIFRLKEFSQLSISTRMHQAIDLWLASVSVGTDNGLVKQEWFKILNIIEHLGKSYHPYRSLTRKFSYFGIFSSTISYLSYRVLEKHIQLSQIVPPIRKGSHYLQMLYDSCYYNLESGLRELLGRILAPLGWEINTLPEHFSELFFATTFQFPYPSAALITNKRWITNGFDEMAQIVHHQMIQDYQQLLQQEANPLLKKKYHIYFLLVNHTYQYLTQLHVSQSSFVINTSNKTTSNIHSSSSQVSIHYIMSHLVIMRLFLTSRRFSYSISFRKLMIMMLSKITTTWQKQFPFVLSPSETSVDPSSLSQAIRSFFPQLQLLYCGYLWLDHRFSEVLQIHRQMQDYDRHFPMLLTTSQRNDGLAFLLAAQMALLTGRDSGAHEVTISSSNQSQNIVIAHRWNNLLHTIESIHHARRRSGSFSTLFLENSEFSPIVINLYVQAILLCVSHYQQALPFLHGSVGSNYSFSDTDNNYTISAEKQLDVLLTPLTDLFTQLVQEERLVLYPRILRMIHRLLQILLSKGKNHDQHSGEQNNSAMNAATIQLQSKLSELQQIYRSYVTIVSVIESRQQKLESDLIQKEYKALLEAEDVNNDDIEESDHPIASLLKEVTSVLTYTTIDLEELFHLLSY